MLTDGLPNQVPPAEDGLVETTVLRASQRAKDAGAQVFTIGVGLATDIDSDLLKAAASHPTDFYHSPDAEELTRIYRQVAGALICPWSWTLPQR
jgi:hypothetical protein